MSKPEKFLSIGIGILQGLEQENMEKGGDTYHIPSDMNAQNLYHALQNIEKKLQQKDIVFCEEKQAQEKEQIEITVLDDAGQGIAAQVKLFPLLSGEHATNYNRVNGKINMIRELTDKTGKLLLELPCGSYAVEVSKGSEYEILTTKLVSIKHDRDYVTNCVTYTLHRFVDLQARHYYAGDLHHHSIFSSPVYGGDDDVIESPAQVANSMKAMGLRFGALSDHHNIRNHAEWKQEETKDFYPIVSKEISTSNGHVLSLGVEHDVIYHIPKAENRTEEVLRAEFRRITKEIKESNGLAQLNHPRDLSVSISWNPKFYDMIDIFETIEIWNGSNPMYYGTTNAKAAILWTDLLEQGRYIPATTGSDTHNIKANDYHQLMDRLLWLNKKIEQEAPCAWKEQYHEEIRCLMLMIQNVFPQMEQWAETNLTSGGVRTYVLLHEKVHTQTILDALRKGHSFLTNGPILIPVIKEKSCGETVTLGNDITQAAITILSNRPLTKLMLYGSHHFSREYKLIEKEETKQENHYDYSMTLSIERAWNCDWIFFVVASDFTNMAMTNPIFLK